jgi:hypothetical protein
MFPNFNHGGPELFLRKESDMNYDDMGIEEYKKKQEKNHNELIGCYAIMFVIVLAICCFCIAYEFVMKILVK